MGKKLQRKKKNRKNQKDSSLNNRGNNLLYSAALDAQKCSIVEDDTKDLMSELPDEILVHILSLLPFDYTIKISALSTRLNDLWTSVQHGAEGDITSVVYDFINKFDELDPLKNPRRLQFHFGQAQILFASIGLDRKLHLDFSKGEQELPRQFCWQLEKNFSNLNINQYPSFTLVTTLKLTSVNYLSMGTISSMVSRLPFLKNLTLKNCKGLQSLTVRGYGVLQSICIEDIPNLINLTVLDCPKLQRLYIKACKLTSLHINERLPRFYLEGNFSLRDVMFDFRESAGDFNFYSHDFDSFLGMIKDVERLTLCRWTFKKFETAWSRMEGFKRLKDLWWIDKSMYGDDILALCSFLKMCPSLERLFISIYHPDRYWLPPFSSWESGLITRNVQLNNLKVVVLEEVRDEENVILLAENLLTEFNVKPRIIVAWHGNVCLRLLRIPQQLGKGNLWKAIFQPHKRKYVYKFVEEVVEHIGLLRHPHMSL